MPIFQLIKNQVITNIDNYLEWVKAWCNNKKRESRWAKDLDTLFSIDEIKSDFQNFEVLELEEKKFNLTKDNFTTVMVIRFVGRKKQ
jgi:hypothetical protein